MNPLQRIIMTEYWLICHETSLIFKPAGDREVNKQNTPHLHTRDPDVRIMIQTSLQTENLRHNDQLLLQSESATVCRLQQTETHCVRARHFLQDGSEQPMLRS